MAPKQSPSTTQGQGLAPPRPGLRRSSLRPRLARSGTDLGPGQRWRKDNHNPKSSSSAQGEPGWRGTA